MLRLLNRWPIWPKPASTKLVPPSMVVSLPEPNRRNQRMENTRKTRRSRSKVLSLWYPPKTERITGEEKSEGRDILNVNPFIFSVHCMNRDHGWVPLVEEMKKEGLGARVHGWWPENRKEKRESPAAPLMCQEEEKKKEKVRGFSGNFWAIPIQFESVWSKSTV
ncbi:hypothetical protein JCGZ_26599 [Jatropha curcas]|uniref:Uncharacterized protein n=1 Tax=Jatropha curcas TaxID=180498 RepID=A0A067JNL1_JATCU|nr:hypothetical protein JCGZ_26599 [Jatropha curcas]